MDGESSVLESEALGFWHQELIEFQWPGGYTMRCVGWEEVQHDSPKRRNTLSNQRSGFFDQFYWDESEK